MSESEKPVTFADEFDAALEEHAPRYGVRLDGQAIARLREYYEQVMAWNARLHLVAPCPPAEFATRHVLESLLALTHIARDAHVADVGSGAGLPIIPCLIARPDLRATLTEASPKKAVFLREALRRAGAHERSTVVAARFEKTHAPDASYVTCRALDRFTELLPELVEWSPPRSTLLLFGGDTLRERLEKSALIYQALRIPESDRRFLFITNKESKVQSPKSEPRS
ncbi:MAG TPA: RsmG family class I SAM-dependent methyltransferase [Pyrinomonadaceae bacterium]|nr:RsmG family class I SAM-dependent methyltransferase [Pyrinomonadaceae bacterium]